MKDLPTAPILQSRALQSVSPSPLFLYSLSFMLVGGFAARFLIPCQTHPGFSPSLQLCFTKSCLCCYECHLPMVSQGGQVAAIKALVLHILMCVFIFYAVYYMMGSICWGVFRLSNFSAQIPFEFEMRPSYMDPNNLARLLSMEITYFTSGVLFAALLRQWVWDYAITVTLTHMLLTFTVMKEFPLVWEWWLALASGLFLMICSGELVICLACSTSNNLSRNGCS